MDSVRSRRKQLGLREKTAFDGILTMASILDRAEVRFCTSGKLADNIVLYSRKSKRSTDMYETRAREAIGNAARNY